MRAPWASFHETLDYSMAFNVATALAHLRDQVRFPITGRCMLWKELPSGAAVPVDDPKEWLAIAMEPVETRRVRVTHLPTEGHMHPLSTVFMGIDHSVLVEGPPLIYQTALFCPDKPGFPQAWWMWGTRESAEHGHAEILAAFDRGVLLDTVKDDALVDRKESMLVQI